MADARGERCERLGPGQSCFQVVDLGRPDIVVIRDNETMMRAVVVFVGRAVRGAVHRHYRPAAGSGRRRLPRHVARWGSPVVTVR